jgi:uncharacterized membrane protein YhaH (DUF805 family)
MDLLFGFSGRIGRLQWWLGQLAIVVLLIVGAVFIFGVAAADPTPAGAMEAITGSGISGALVILTILVLTTWINIATTVKRFHDRNKSGLWFLIVFIPYIGAIWQIVECGFLSGTPGANNYGSRGGGRYDLDDFDVGIPDASPRASRSRMERMAPAAAPAPQPAAPRRPTQTGFGRRGL